MKTPILVTGGTGTIGRHVVPLLQAAGQDVRVLTRHPHPDGPGLEHVAGDTVKNLGLPPALHGVDTVLHLAGGARGDGIGAANVARAAELAGVGHLILISVVGADSMPIGYFRAKAGAERAFSNSSVPSTVLRVAQLHNFVLTLVRTLARMPLIPVPGGLRFEPVQVEEVAAKLVELALGGPAGRVADLAGPEVLDLTALLAAYAAVHGRAHPRVPVHIPGAAGRAYRSGKNLAGRSAQRGDGSWGEFLAERSGLRLPANQLPSGLGK